MKIKKDTVRVLIVCALVCFLAFMFAYFYYGRKNSARDPLVRAARQWLDESEKLIENKQTLEALRVLDSAWKAYNRLPAYQGSFEFGIIHNNRCSALLMAALYDSSLLKEEKARYLGLAKAYADSSIQCYTSWLGRWEKAGIDSLRTQLEPHYRELAGTMSQSRQKRILNQRLDDFALAQIETPRRLSVALTNRGTVLRHQYQPDSALRCFEQALALWKHNRAATSNLEVLKGGKPVKPSVIQSLFPPEKNKKE